jgi:hypothetical protein
LVKLIEDVPPSAGVQALAVPGSDHPSPRVTRYHYAPDGGLSRLTVSNPDTGDQVTEWRYSATHDTDCVARSDLLKAKHYPLDLDATGQVIRQTTYSDDQQSRVIGSTDPNGTAHAYIRDSKLEMHSVLWERDQDQVFAAMNHGAQRGWRLRARSAAGLLELRDPVSAADLAETLRGHGVDLDQPVDLEFLPNKPNLDTEHGENGRPRRQPLQWMAQPQRWRIASAEPLQGWRPWLQRRSVSDAFRGEKAGLWGRRSAAFRRWLN